MALKSCDKIFLLLFALTLLSLPFLPSAEVVHAATITHVAGQSGRGLWVSGTTFSVTLAQTPTANNLLIATIMTASSSGAARTVSSIAETNVVWTYQIRKTNTASAKLDVEIWVGVVSASANSTLVITLSAAPGYGAIADVYEYSGLALTDFLDKTATNTANSASPDTGTTATTTVANELWIGATAIASGGSLSQNTPTNGFTLYDGAGSSLKSLAFLEKIVTSTGAANSGTTSTQSNYWVGCIATFKAASASYTADLTLGLSFVFVDSKYYEATRSVVLSLAFALSSLVSLEFLKTVTQGLGFAFTNAMSLEYPRTVALGLGFAFSNAVLLEFSRMVALGLAFAFSNSRASELLRSVSQSIGFAYTNGKLGDWLTTVLLGLSFLFNTETVREFTRAITQSISFSFQSGRALELLRAASQSLTFSFSGERFTELTRPVTEELSLLFGGSREKEVSRSTSHGLGFAYSVLAEKISGAEEYLREVAGSISFSFSSTRLQELLRSVSDSLSFSFSDSRLAEYLRGVSQSLSFGFSSLTDSIMNYMRTVSQGLAFSFSSARLSELSRSVSQSLSHIFSTDAWRELARSVTQGLGFSLSNSRLIEYSRSVTQSISVVFSSSRLSEVERAVSQHLAANYGTVGNLNAKNLFVNVGIVLTISTAVTSILLISANKAYAAAGYALLFLIVIPVTVILVIVLRRR